MHFAVWIEVFSEIERHCVVVCIKCQLCECMHMSHELLCFSIELLVSGSEWTNISFQSVWIDFLNFVEQPKESKRKFFILPILDLSIDKVDSVCQFYEKKSTKLAFDLSIWLSQWSLNHTFLWWQFVVSFSFAFYFHEFFQHHAICTLELRFYCFWMFTCWLKRAR